MILNTPTQRPQRDFMLLQNESNYKIVCFSISFERRLNKYIYTNRVRVDFFFGTNFHLNKNIVHN